MLYFRLESRERAAVGPALCMAGIQSEESIDVFVLSGAKLFLLP